MIRNGFKILIPAAAALCFAGIAVFRCSAEAEAAEPDMPEEPKKFSLSVSGVFPQKEAADAKVSAVYIDWAESWMPTTGMPDAGLHGPITMESLLVLLGLQKAAELAEYLEKPEMASEWRTRAERLQQAIRACCLDDSGMLTDGPGRTEISQHAQVFGILTGTLSREEGRRNLLRTMEERGITQCSVATCF